MSKDKRDKDWQTFSNWERAYKKKFLKSLSTESAFSIFSGLDYEKKSKIPEEIKHDFCSF